MDYLIVGLGGGILLAVGVIVWMISSRKGSASHFSYAAAGPVLSSVELDFYRALQSAYDNTALILCKVRAADIIQPEEGLKQDVSQALLERIAPNEFDFVLCDPDNLSVRCVIRLDHGESDKERRQNNELLVSACQSAAVNMRLVDVQQSLSVEELRALESPLPEQTEVVPETAEAADPALVGNTDHDHTVTEPQKSEQAPLSPVLPETNLMPEAAAPQHEEEDPFSLSSLISDPVPEETGSDFDSDIASWGSEESSDSVLASGIEDTPAAAESAPAAPEPAVVTPAAEAEAVAAAPSPAPVVPEPAAAPEAVVEADTSHHQHIPRPAAKPLHAVTEPHCPRCHAPLVQHTPKSGKLVGQLLWICSTFPECRYAAPFDAHDEPQLNRGTG
jgi:hypothetical protein